MQRSQPKHTASSSFNKHQFKPSKNGYLNITSISFILFLLVFFFVSLNFLIYIITPKFETNKGIRSNVLPTEPNQNIITSKQVSNLLQYLPKKQKEFDMTYFEGFDFKNEAHEFCAHYNTSKQKENLQFLPLTHLMHGSKNHSAPILTCRSLDKGLSLFKEVDSPVTEEMINLGTHFFKRCLRCGGNKHINKFSGLPVQYEEEKFSFERLVKIRDRYINKNKLDGLLEKDILEKIERRSKNERILKINDKDYDIIAIVMGVTSRGLAKSAADFDLNKFYLVAEVFPAYAKYLDPGFEYWFILSVDVGDLVFENEEMVSRLTLHFQNTVVKSANSINAFAQLKLVYLKNTAKKPGPAFNYGLGCAYADGANYFYRTNDDVIPTSPFSKRLVEALSLNRNFGVVSPIVETDTRGNPYILTVDFVSRVHFDIFSVYYPAVLADWCMDDWISRIYGNHYTCQVAQVTVKHVTLGNEIMTRYKIDSSVKCLLELEYYLGDHRLHQWLKEVGLTSRLHHGFYGKPLADY
eukprot:snap_masked-scaffold_6-processed-gene-16.29-mRNA-1 protein AED:1.00 eAED:1.00 QI:0/0/0/0/1/1/2/0/522